MVSWNTSLLAGMGSGVVAATDASLVMTTATVVATTTVIVATAPATSPPSGHVTILASVEQLPWLGTADTKFVNPGKRIRHDDARGIARSEVRDRDRVGDVVPEHDRVGGVGLRDRKIGDRADGVVSVAESLAAFGSRTGDDVIEAVFETDG